VIQISLAKSTLLIKLKGVALPTLELDTKLLFSPLHAHILNVIEYFCDSERMFRILDDSRRIKSHI
jgi:hypothetical protein